MELVLGKVPSTIGEPLTIKAGISGITYLKQSTFRSRYTGNKFYAVDINGAGIHKKSDLKLLANGGEPVKKRKARVETQAVGINFQQDVPAQISGNTTELQADINNISPALSTKLERHYRVNKREIRQRLLGYMNTQRGAKELYFWTVTFPPVVKDEQAYVILNTWLTRLRQVKMLKNYLWVAERQPQTGTIHFHIAIPHKMYAPRANAMMAGTLKNFAKKKLIALTVHQCKKYNGVDIAKNRETRRVTNFAIKKGSRALVGYLTKYVTKNDETFSHLAWHNSRGYSSIFTGVTFTITEFKTINHFQFMLNSGKKFENDFFCFIPWRDGPPPRLTSHLFELNSFIQSQLN
jgi:hypothetical protein